MKTPTQNFVTVAVVDAEKRVDNSLVQIWKLKFGHNAIFCSGFEHMVWQDFEVKFRRVKLNFCQYFTADIWLRL